jgi:hypothetical protein
MYGDGYNGRDEAIDRIMNWVIVIVVIAAFIFCVWCIQPKGADSGALFSAQTPFGSYQRVGDEVTFSDLSKTANGEFIITVYGHDGSLKTATLDGTSNHVKVYMIPGDEMWVTVAVTNSGGYSMVNLYLPTPALMEG